MLSKARAFFSEKGILEVDCPLLSPFASVDAHIDLIPVSYNHQEIRYLHSSPEYGMKRLLAEGMGDIYQLSHVFRDGEWGRKHNPEFMMAEWYRKGFSFTDLMEETFAFIELFLGSQHRTIISYREAFKTYTGIDYVHASASDLKKYLIGHQIPFYDSIEKEDRDALLNLILAHSIEPHLGDSGLCALAYYPASQAALAQKIWIEDEEAAERFEVYYKGIELCNGYHELANSQEQRLRLQEANRQRRLLGKSPLPLDERFLEALELGLPDCCGVAVGFDRLMMLRQNLLHLQDAIPFGWDRA